MFYTYRQNNSGGSFDFDGDLPVSLRDQFFAVPQNLIVGAYIKYDIYLREQNSEGTSRGDAAAVSKTDGTSEDV